MLVLDISASTVILEPPPLPPPLTTILTLPFSSAATLFMERTIFLLFHLSSPEGLPLRVADCAESTAINEKCPSVPVSALPQS